MIRIEGIPIVAARLAAVRVSTRLIETSRRRFPCPPGAKTIGKTQVQPTDTRAAA